MYVTDWSGKHRPHLKKGSNSSRFDCYKLGDLVVKCGFWTRLASHILAMIQSVRRARSVHVLGTSTRTIDTVCSSLWLRPTPLLAHP